MTDNVAVLEGFTKEVVSQNAEVSLHLLVRPDTDFDYTFKAWDMDEQEFVYVKGWMFVTEEVGNACDD